jgi:hypothetical protein
VKLGRFSTQRRLGVRNAPSRSSGFGALERIQASIVTVAELAADIEWIGEHGGNALRSSRIAAHLNNEGHHADTEADVMKFLVGELRAAVTTHATSFADE